MKNEVNGARGHTAVENSVRPEDRPSHTTRFYTKGAIDRCVGAAHDVLLGPPSTITRDYENGVKDALRLFQTALALTA